jgi:hypothetical protein
MPDAGDVWVNFPGAVVTKIPSDKVKISLLKPGRMVPQ